MNLDKPSMILTNISVHSKHWLVSEAFFQSFTISSWKAIIAITWLKCHTDSAANILTNSTGDANLKTGIFSELKLDWSII